eukprot:g9552.t1 g9552   contig37:233841-235688(-)
MSEDKENIDPNRRKAVASSAISPAKKRLKKTAANSKVINVNVDSTTIHRMKTLLYDVAASDRMTKVFTEIINSNSNNEIVRIMRSTMKQQISIRHDESTNEKDRPQSMNDMEMQFRDEMYKAIVAEGNKCDVDFSNRINFGDCIDASMDSLCTLNYATLKEIKRPKEGRGKYNLINGHSSGCPRMMEVSVGKRFQSLKFEEAKKEGEKARSDFRLENLRFNDGIVIAFDKPKKYGTTLQTIQRNLGLKSVDYLHAISVLLRIFHALLHWEVNKKPLNSLCCSAEIFLAQFGEGKENGFDGKLISLKGQCRHPEWMMRGFAAGCTNAELEPFDRALCTFLANSKEMREELKSRGVDLDEFNEPVSINLSFSDLDGLSEEERACYLLNRQEGSRLGGQRCGLLHHITSKVASSVLESASSFEDLRLSDDLFDDAVMLCDVVHEGSVKTTLSALQSLKKGHGLLSLMKTIAKNNTLTDITNATSLDELKMSEEDRALLHQHGETKSIASLFAIKRGHKDRMASEGVTVDGKSKKSLTMIRSRETKRQEELETLGSKRLFCGYCGETKFFKEGSRVRGTCLESCYSRDYGFSRHYHSEWKVTKPSQTEMNELNDYRARK